MDIAELRQRIDTIDRQLVELLNQRCQCAREIGYLKRSLDLPIYEPNRESTVLANIGEANRAMGGPLSELALRRVFERIIDEMRTIQKDELLREREKQP
ncbi:MAG TPA: chorismate mutase [Terriglobales bacterium]|nr:chorismate mutase [Terriglobales bacterium]